MSNEKDPGKVSNLAEYRKEKFESVTKAITQRVQLFLEHNAINNASVVWDSDSDIFILSFTLVENDTKAPLLVGGELHASLVNSLESDPPPELEGYMVNPYTNQGFISFIKY